MTDYTALANGGIASIRPYQAGKPISEVKRELGLEDITKLASNENPFGMGRKAAAAAVAAIADCNFYPDPSGFSLKRRLREKFGYDESCVTLGAGSNELINLLFQLFANAGTRVVMPEYSFIVYPMEATVGAAQVTEVPLRDYTVDLDALAAACDAGTRIVVLANPSNPLGTAVDNRKVKEFLGKIRPETLVVIDEAYNEFNEDPNYVDSATLIGEHPNLVVSRTFSKAYGLAGLRVGYMVSNPEISSLLNRLRAPFNVSAPALAAAEAALDDDEFLAMVVRSNNQERRRYQEFCDAHGLRMIPSEANFVAIDFAREAKPISDALLRRGLIVRPVANYRLPTFLRISIGTPEQNDRLFAALSEVLRDGTGS
ncbi:MAG: histidinol-phosphate transaminase [Succinivibrionaceae bacterium]|nr:histidinol-phosphate transaminase [Succinivibrionaceae bacterium]